MTIQEPDQNLSGDAPQSCSANDHTHPFTPAVAPAGGPVDDDDTLRDATLSAHDLAVLGRHWRDRVVAAADEAARAAAEARVRALAIGDPTPANVGGLAEAHRPTVARYRPELVERTQACAISRREARLLAAGWSNWLAESEWADRYEQVSLTNLIAEGVAWGVLDSLYEHGLLTEQEVADLHRACRARLGLDQPFELDGQGRPYDPRHLARPRNQYGYTEWQHVWAGPRVAPDPTEELRWEFAPDYAGTGPDTYTDVCAADDRGAR
jgi:hypothetical protein